MLGALAAEVIAPTKNPKSRASIKARHDQILARKKGAKKKKAEEKMKSSEPARRATERGTGASVFQDPLRGVAELAKAKKKRK